MGAATGSLVGMGLTAGTAAVAGPAFMTLGSGSYGGMIAQGASPFTAMGLGGMFAGSGLGGVMTGINAVTGIMSAFGAYQTGQTQQEMYQYNALMAERNAIIAQNQADMEKKLLKRRMRKAQGSMMVALAGAGVEPTTGTPLDLWEELAILGEEDVLMTQYNADLKKSGFVAEATQARYIGESAAQQGKMKAAGTLLTTGFETYKYGEELGMFG